MMGKKNEFYYCELPSQRLCWPEVILAKSDVIKIVEILQNGVTCS